MAFPKNSEIDNVLLQVLVDLGGHARPQDVYPRVAEFFPQLTSEDLEVRLPSSVHTRKWWNAVQWAKQRLQDNQCIDGTPNRFEGEWEITQRGREVLQLNLPVRPSTITATKTSSFQEAAHSSPLFSAKTFELLELLHAHPTQVFYKEHKDEFKTHLETPLETLFQKIAGLLPSEMTEMLETENRILARIPKNDYGQGGAWDFLWGAFYPKGGRRIEDGQLYVTLYHEGLKSGFSVADYGKEARARFASNLKAMPADHAAKLSQSLVSCGILYGEHDDGYSSVKGAGQTKSLGEWINNLGQYGPTAKIYIAKNQVVSMSGDELAGKTADLFKRLFPLFLMARQEQQSAQQIAVEAAKPTAVPVGDNAEDDDADIAPQGNIEHCDKIKAMNGLFLGETQFDEMLDALKEKKNVVLQGAPGVGKTFVAKRLAYALNESNDQRQVEMIQFHQSYSYEDFIQGFRPTPNGHFELKFGIFYQFCRRAQRDEAAKKPYVFIIDEINRGNLSKIFGELMMLIEPDKRGKKHAIPLAYSQNGGERFYIPENLHLIGMMNTADRSLAMVDYALRRRFRFITLRPEFSSPAFGKFLGDTGASPELANKIVSRMNALNEVIAADTKNLGPGYQIGHSYFCPRNGMKPSEDWYRRVIESEIVPLIQEYWFDNEHKVKEQRSALLA
jgi:AAA domain (dynein-related subfamily)/Mrr N-terminal domain